MKGHGVGGDTELGAQVMQEIATEVLDELDGRFDRSRGHRRRCRTRRWHRLRWRTVLARELARLRVPVYVLGILPGADEGALYQVNAGRSLKTVAREADAVLLVDNDAFRRPANR